MWQTLPQNSTQQDIRGNLMSPREICTSRYLHPAGALIITNTALLFHNVAAAAMRRALYFEYCALMVLLIIIYGKVVSLLVTFAEKAGKVQISMLYYWTSTLIMRKMSEILGFNHQIVNVQMRRCFQLLVITMRVILGL